MKMLGCCRLLLILFASFGTAARAELPPTDLIAAAAEWELAEMSVPSITIAAFDRSGVVWSHSWGYADPDRRARADTSTIYRAGSVSKLFTDVAVMRLVERGELDLDEPVQTYLPSFHPHNPFDAPITLRQLMTHRSGLVREPPRGNYFDMNPKGQADTVASLNDTTLVARPGTVTKYSNAAIAVVGEVLAAVTENSFEDAVRDLVFSPLDMNASTMRLSPVKGKLAYSEMAAFDGPRFAAPQFDLGMPAAGNLYTTAGDLARFGVTMLNRGAGLLKPSAVDEMWRVQYPTISGSRRFGLGFIVDELDGQRMAGHPGAVYGFSTELQLLPDAGIGVVVFSTVDSGTSAARLARFALKAWSAVQDGKPVPTYAQPEPVTGAEAKRLSGWYTDGTHSVSARIHAGQLALDGPERAGMVRKTGGHYLIADAQSFHDKLAFSPDGSWLELDDIRYVRCVQPQPPEPGPAIAALIGEYGWEHNKLRFYERNGIPWIRIEWVDYRPLTKIDSDTYAFPTDRGLYPLEALRVERGANGQPTALLLNGIRWPRRDFGAEVQSVVRRGVVANLDSIYRTAIAARPPVEAPKPRQSDLVELKALDPSVRLDIRYARTDNFMGVPLYKSAAAFLQRPAVQAIAAINQDLHTLGYGLLIFDAYRPWFVTKMFSDATPVANRQFVADPLKGSRHNRGAAVDLTMYSLKTGEPVVSTGRYDEFSDRSYSNYVGGSDHQRWIRDLLRTAMERHGFAIYPEEWWHFDFGGWSDYSIGNQSFNELRAVQKK